MIEESVIQSVSHCSSFLFVTSASFSSIKLGTLPLLVSSNANNSEALFENLRSAATQRGSQGSKT